MPKKTKENAGKRGVGQPRKYLGKCLPVAISMPPELVERLESGRRRGESRSAAAVRLISEGLEIAPTNVPRRRMEETV